MISSNDHLTIAQTRLSRSRRGFTLVELLAVIFIISLLIGILLPSLSGARNQAKNLQVKATLKVIGDGLEMFRTENEKEFRGSNGYPPSAFADDPTEVGGDKLSGAHWLARCLVGKDLQGFVPRRNVPPSLQAPGTVDEQEKWYDGDATTNGALERVGPYVNTEGLEVVKTKDLGSGTLGDFGSGGTTGEEILFTDIFGAPILYYAANPLAKSRMAREDPTTPTTDPATYTWEDNIVFTGNGGSKLGWDFGGGKGHKISTFGNDTPETIQDLPESFCYYVLDKKIFEASFEAGVPQDDSVLRAVNPTGSMLISPGIDLLYGTSDDVTNFER